MSNKIGRRIKPSKILVNYLREVLLITRLKSKGIIELDDEDLKLIRNNDEMKVRVMDTLFKSFADLIYFFEFLNDHPELIDKFDVDIEDLFGLKAKQKDPKLDSFRRFIEAILGHKNKVGKKALTDPRFNYQRRLLAIMQSSIHRTAWGYFMISRENTNLREWAHNGLAIAESVTRNIDKPTLSENKNPRRVLGF